MKPLQGRERADFDWYSEESRRHKLPPRCPFASVDLCPKYYESVALLGSAEATTSLQPEDAKRLERKWANWLTPLAEQAPSSLRSERGFVFVSHLCPEIGYDIYGHFASGFHWYPGEMDAELAYERLSKEGIPNTDPRWKWATVFPEHYTECRLYSILSAAASIDSSAKARQGTKARIPPSLRWRVLARDSYTCTYCGRKPPEVILEVDHKVSEADGGHTELANLVTACAECNRGKGSRSSNA